jgi:hypothetical protein
VQQSVSSPRPAASPIIAVEHPGLLLACSYCGAEPWKRCRTKSGRPRLRACTLSASKRHLAPCTSCDNASRAPPPGSSVARVSRDAQRTERGGDQAASETVAGSRFFENADEGGRGGSFTIIGVRLGVADHLGWAVAVTAAPDHSVVDRRRIELVEPGVSAAPIHYESRRLDVAATAALVATVRASVVRACSAALDDLAAALPAPVVSISLRLWPADFPDDIAVQRRAPYEARADAIMYRHLLAELARARGWEIHRYDARQVEAQAAGLLGEQADEVLHGPRATLGPPWTKDHRLALAATVVAGDELTAAASGRQGRSRGAAPGASSGRRIRR